MKTDSTDPHQERDTSGWLVFWRGASRFPCRNLPCRLGRLAAYLLVGAMVGVLAVHIDSPLLRRATGIALVLVSLLLLFFVLTQRSPTTALCRMFHGRERTMPVLFGFLTGINVCPPFLPPISYAAGVGSIAGSMLVFLGVFLGTSLYLTLLLPFGWAGKYENFRLIGQIAAVLSGVLFLVIGAIYPVM